MNEITGVPAHPTPWPVGEQFDKELLANGDARNVVDKYRYWTVDAIKADLDTQRLPLEIAIENWQRDFNMGTIIRTANAFNIRKVHIIGRKQWNKRGAMVTDLYMNIEYYQSIEAFVRATQGKRRIGVDIIEGAESITQADLPENAVLVFGAEGPGLSSEMIRAVEKVVKIDQYGSTRSVNVGVAAGIAMYQWVSSHFQKIDN